jgi:hypothetical protein
MSWDTQDVLDSMDKNNVEGFAEALLISIASLKKDGKVLRVRLGNTIEDDIDFAHQIARMMLGSREGV